MTALPNSIDHQHKTPPDIVFSLLPASPLELGHTNWIYQWQTAAGDRTMSLARHGEGFLVRFPDLADFVLSKEGNEIGVWPMPETDNETLSHLILDQILPRLLAHQGRLILHASAIDIGEQAVAFVGESGRGKSTLAASFYMAGFNCLVDDSLIATLEEDRVLALPTYSGLRLWPPSIHGVLPESAALAPVAQYSNKRRLATLQNSSARGLPLVGIYILTEHFSDQHRETITLTPLSQQDACLKIIGHSLQLDVTAPLQAERMFDLATEVAVRVPFFKLSYPRSYSTLPDVRAAILQQHK